MAKATKSNDGQQSWIYDGSLDGAPGWVDKGWAAYDSGPALAVPNGDPNGQPYTTTVARKGDTILFTPKKGDGSRSHDMYKVVPASETGNFVPAQESTLPAQTTQATLEDLDKTGSLKYSEMDDEQKAQYDARAVVNGAPAANRQDDGTPARAESSWAGDGLSGSTPNPKAAGNIKAKPATAAKSASKSSK